MKLKNYLGTWRYTHGSADKYYRVIPQDNSEKYQINWGDNPKALDSKEKKLVVDAEEAFRRLRSKAKGGFSLIEPYTGKMPKSAELLVADLFPKAQTTPPPPEEKKKKFSFLDWVAGKN